MSVRGCGGCFVEYERELVWVNKFLVRVFGRGREEEVRRTRDTEPEFVWMGLE